jgi:hypothetical protein
MLGHQGPDHVDHGAGAYNMPNAGHSEPTARLGGVTGASASRTVGAPRGVLCGGG